MMSFAVIVLPEPLRSRSAGTFTGSYQSIGTPFDHQICLLKILNDTTVGVTVSWDGVNDHDYLPANSFSLYDITAQTQRESGIYISKGTQLRVKGSVGAGSVYVVALYPRGG